MAMQFKRQVKAEESVNLTPLIDVVFLLLIFFMVSTTFTKETHLNIDLPEAVANPASTAKEQIEVIIDASGGYSVNGRALVNNQASTLKAAIESYTNNDKTVPFIITADKAATHQSVVQVMNTAGQLGIVNISITAINPAEQAN